MGCAKITEHQERPGVFFPNFHEQKMSGVYEFNWTNLALGVRCSSLLAMATWSLSHGSDPSVKRAQKTPTDRGKTAKWCRNGKLGNRSLKQPESMGFPLTQVYLKYRSKTVSSYVIEALSLLCGTACGIWFLSDFVCILSKFFFLSTFISDTSQPDAITWIVTRS